MYSILVEIFPFKHDYKDDMGVNKRALVTIQFKSLNIKLIFIRPIFFITCGRTRYILHFWWDTFYEMHFKFKFQTRFMDLIRNLYIY